MELLAPGNIKKKLKKKKKTARYLGTTESELRLQRKDEVKYWLVAIVHCHFRMFCLSVVSQP
jgi:hypothetical protein